MLSSEVGLRPNVPVLYAKVMGMLRERKVVIWGNDGRLGRAGLTLSAETTCLGFDFWNDPWGPNLCNETPPFWRRGNEKTTCFLLAMENMVRQK